MVASYKQPPPSQFCTYDHRILRTRLPVRSAIFKQDTGGLVVRWVTTSESPLLYVFDFCLELRMCDVDGMGGRESAGDVVVGRSRGGKTS